MACADRVCFGLRMQLRQTIRRGLRKGAISCLLGYERVRTGQVYDPLKQSYLDDPYATFARLRAHDPMHRSYLIGWVATSYDDVAEILKEPRFLVEARNGRNFERLRKNAIELGFDEEQIDNPSMLLSDPPRHTRLRTLVSKAFTPRKIRAMQPRMEQVVTELLDAADADGQFELVETLAYPLPVIMICELLGVPAEDRDRFKAWSDALAATLGFPDGATVRRGRKAGAELNAYLTQVVEQRRAEPRDDLITGLVAAEEAGDRLSTYELFNTCQLLLVAGNETTTNLIGNGTLALLRNPKQLQLLLDDPSLVEGAVEELLRFDPPVQFTGRIAGEDMTVGECTVRKGQTVLVALASANRDPTQFERPDELDITRSDVPHFSLSHGVHFCLGASLARLEAQVAFRALAARYRSIELADADVPRSDNAVLRGVRRMQLRVERR